MTSQEATHLQALRVEDYQDEVCSYNSDDDDDCSVTHEDRSDATYDVEYPFEDRGVNLRPEVNAEEEEEEERTPQEEHRPLLPTVSSDSSIPDEVEPDSLAGNHPGQQTSSEDDEQDDPKTIVDKRKEDRDFENDSEDFEPECSFRDKENQFNGTSTSQSSVCPSRASVDSQRSISFFIDLDDDLHNGPSQMSRSIVQPRNQKLMYRTQSQGPDRMTQSMYADPKTASSRVSPTGSGVSFFVDLNEISSRDPPAAKSNRQGSFVKTVSREEADRDLTDVSEDMQVKSKLLMEKSIESTQVFFNKLKEYIDYLGKPSYSKDELRQKKFMAANITRLMFEEEENLRSGRILSESHVLDQILTDESGQQQANIRRQIPRTQAKENRHHHHHHQHHQQKPKRDESQEEEKPVLRRERTFEIDPKMSIRQISIPLDSSPTHPEVNGNEATNHHLTTGNEVSNLEMFQQQRLLHTKRLKKEIIKLEKMEHDFAANANKVEKEQPKSRAKSPQLQSQVPPKPQMRQCWGEKVEKESSTKKSEKLTSFKNLDKNGKTVVLKSEDRDDVCSVVTSSSSMTTSWCSWFIPSEENPEESVLHPTTGADNRCSNSRREFSKGSQTGDSLLRQFRERKDKSCFVRDRPQAYFLACEDKPPESNINNNNNANVDVDDVEKKKIPEGPVAKPRTIGIVRCYQAREEAPLVKTRVIDLETETLPEENNLQEALRKHRPDYIARVKDRDRDRMVRSFVAEQRRSAASAASDAMSRSSTSLSPLSHQHQQASKKQIQRFSFSHSPYLGKNSVVPARQQQQQKQQQQPQPRARGLSKEGSTSSIERPTSSTSSTTKSRIPRTTASLYSGGQKSLLPKAEVCQASSVYGYISGRSDVARVNEPLQLRGPNTATVYSSNGMGGQLSGGYSSEAKQKDPHYKTNRIMATSRGKVMTSSVRRTEAGRLNNKSGMFNKGHSMLDSSKVLVR